MCCRGDDGGMKILESKCWIRGGGGWGEWGWDIPMPIYKVWGEDSKDLM